MGVIARTTSHIPGRIRIKIPQAKYDAELLETAVQEIAKIAGVQEAHPNSRTGSVLFPSVSQPWKLCRSLSGRQRRFG